MDRNDIYNHSLPPEQNGDENENQLLFGDTTEEDNQETELTSRMATLSEPEDPPDEDSPSDYPDAPYLYDDAQNENIVLNSGHVQHTVTDFVLPGRDGFDLVMQRSYNSADAGIEKMREAFSGRKTDCGDFNHFSRTYGLGNGWRFMLPSIEVLPHQWRGATDWYIPILHLDDGRSFNIITEGDAEDAGIGFSSYRQKDIQIERQGGSIKHPYLPGAKRTYEYRVMYQNGSVDYFGRVNDYHGTSLDGYTLVGRKDRFDNTIFFDFQLGVPGQQTIIEFYGLTIYDTWGRAISLVKHPEENGDYTLQWQLPKNKPEDAEGQTISYKVSHTHVHNSIENYTEGYNFPVRRLEKVTDQVGRVTEYTYHAPETYQAHSKLYEHDDGRNFHYLLLEAIHHPTGAKTCYEYGMDGTPSPIRLMDKDDKGYFQYFPIRERRDEYYDVNDLDDNQAPKFKTFNLQNFSYAYNEPSDPAPQDRIGRATVKKSAIRNQTVQENQEKYTFKIREEHTFDDLHLLREKKIWQLNGQDGQEKLSHHSQYVYGDDYGDIRLYKLLLHATIRDYQPTTADGTNALYTEKTIHNDYSHDHMGNLIHKEEIYSGLDTYNQITDMEYGVYGIMVKKTYRKDENTRIREQYDLIEQPVPLSEPREYVYVVGAKSIYELENDQEEGTLKEQTRFFYEEKEAPAVAEAPFQPVQIRRYYAAVSEAGEHYHDTMYFYNKDQFTHEPYAVRVLNVLNATGGSYTEDPDDYDVVEHSHHDAYGRVVRKVDANGWGYFGHYDTQIEYDGLGRVIQERYPEMNGVHPTKTYVYDDANNTITITDENGYRQRIAYTPLGKVSRVYTVGTDAQGNETTVLLQKNGYDALGRLKWENIYDGEGEKEGRTGETGDNRRRIVEYEYDERNRVIQKKIAPPSGSSGYLEVHSYTDVAAAEEDGALVSVHEKRIVGEAGAPDVVATTYTNPLGLVVKETLAGDVTARYTYDRLGNRLTQTDGRGHETSWQYDYAGRQVSTTNAMGFTSTTEYDMLGQKIRTVDFNGHQTTYQYDAAGRLVMQRTPFEDKPNGAGEEHGITIYNYDPSGNVSQVAVKQLEDAYYDKTMPEGTPKRQYQLTNYGYDRRNRQTSVTQLLNDAGTDWIHTQYTLDALGNKTEVRTGVTPSSPGRLSARYSYDRFGNITAITDALNQTETYAYDNTGRLESKTDRNGNRTSYRYDAMDQLLRETVLWRGPDGAHTMDERSHTYARNGKKLTEMVTETKNGRTTQLQTRYHYNAKGQLQTQMDPDGVAKFFSYDVNGNRLCFQLYRVTNENPDLRLTCQEYDTLVRRLATGEWMPPTAQDYETAGNGQPVTARDFEERGKLALAGITYDIYETNDNPPRTYRLGRSPFAQLSEGLAKIEIDLRYEYDALNRLEKVFDRRSNDLLLAQYSYDANGNRLTLAHPQNAITTHYTYNKANLVTRLENWKNGALVSGYSYTYRPDGNQTHKINLITWPDPNTWQDVSENHTYQYDILGRLVREKNPDFSTIEYEYDAYNNRTRMYLEDHAQYENSYTSTYQYDDAGRLVREEKQPIRAIPTVWLYSYDRAGNQTARWKDEWLDERQTRVYNGFGQLVGVSLYYGTQVTYRYRPDGMRHSKASTSYNTTYTTIHHWDGQNMVMETNGATGVTKGRYLRGTNLLAQEIDGAKYYYTYNAHGDVIQRICENGDAAPQYDYDAFGNELTWNTDPNPFRYCGEYWDDETNLIYLRARYYDSKTGRFISEDPVRSGDNWYAYASNNPVRMIDPSGKISEEAAQKILERKRESSKTTKAALFITGKLLWDMTFGPAVKLISGVGKFISGAANGIVDAATGGFYNKMIPGENPWDKDAAYVGGKVTGNIITGAASLVLMALGVMSGAGITAGTGGLLAPMGIGAAVTAVTAGGAGVISSIDAAAKNMEQLFNLAKGSSSESSSNTESEPIGLGDEGHIFRDKEGHLSNTPENQKTLLDMANNPENFVGTDKYGCDWYSLEDSNGGQLWARVWKDKIIDGGRNAFGAHRTYDPRTGFSNPNRPW